MFTCTSVCLVIAVQMRDSRHSSMLSWRGYCSRGGGGGSHIATGGEQLFSRVFGEQEDLTSDTCDYHAYLM